MPTIEVTEEQYDRLDSLREELAEEFVGPYGTVRERDAVEYLLDLHADGEGIADPGDSESTGEGGRADGESTGDAGDDSGVDADSEAEREGESDGDGADGDEASGEDRLSAMMQLLDEHDGKWRETDSEDGNYEVDLPDGDVTVVRTKDDVRATLFKHY